MLRVLNKKKYAYTYTKKDGIRYELIIQKDEDGKEKKVEFKFVIENRQKATKKPEKVPEEIRHLLLQNIYGKQ